MARVAKLTDQQAKFVSFYVGEARMNASLAARMAGYSAHGSVAHEVLNKPHVRAEIDRVLDELRSENILNKRNRLEILVEMSDRALAIREARADHYAQRAQEGHEVEPGAETGMLCRSPKAIPTGHGDFEIVDEWAYDRALASDIRSTLEQTARELGEWNEKHQITGEDGGPLKVESADSAEQKFFAAIAELITRDEAAQVLEEPNE